jgi:hypothetical protein
VSSKVRFEDEADAEYRNAGRWYEDRRTGLGVEFFDEVDAVVRLILDLPRAGERVPRTRRLAGAPACGEALPLPRRLPGNPISGSNLGCGARPSKAWLLEESSEVEVTCYYHRQPNVGH